MISSPKSFILHVTEPQHYQTLVNKYKHHEVIIIIQDTKPRCSFVYKTLLSSETYIVDKQTNKNYKCTLKQAMELMLKANVTETRVELVRVDLTELTAVWSRLTAHFPEFSRSNELTVNAEIGKYIIYPNTITSGKFVVETDNPDKVSDIMIYRTVTSDGVPTNIKILNDPTEKVWNVQYEVTDSNIIVLRTETVNTDKLNTPITRDYAKKYSYEFLSSLKDAIFCIVSQTFQPKWV